MGNYSKNPQTAYQDAVQKGYARVRFQQGKPILDRELNLLADLAGPQRLAQYIGSGVPAGSDGFRITNLAFATNDFTIKSGSALVNGYEVVLAADTTYKTQPRKEKVGPLPVPGGAAVGRIYLRVFVTEANETQDPDLQNPADVGFETALRDRVEWEVIATLNDITTADHMLLANYTSTGAVTDRRALGLTLSKVRDELNAAAASAVTANARLDLIMGATNTIKDNIVTTTKIADLAVGNPKLADNSVSSTKIAPGTIGNAHLTDASVNNPKLADNSVTFSKIAADNVGTAHLKSGSVTFDRMGFVQFLNQQLTVTANGAATVMIHPVSGTSVPRFIIHNVVGLLQMSGVSPQVWWYEYITLTARYMVVINQTGVTQTVHILSYWLP